MTDEAVRQVGSRRQAGQPDRQPKTNGQPDGEERKGQPGRASLQWWWW